MPLRNPGSAFGHDRALLAVDQGDYAYPGLDRRDDR